MEKPKCIFHLPFTPKPDIRPSGTNIRPPKMLAGFKEAGYEVFEIVGDSRQRRKRISEAKRLIRSGVKFDFLYGESETNPMLVTDPDHIPRFFSLDFAFFRFCRESGIPVGVFYRDANWCASDYSRLRKGALARIMILLHRYDLWQYSRSIDVLFVPSVEFAALIAPYVGDISFVPLPSGCESVLGADAREEGDGRLRLLYVGGISVGEAYDLTDLLKAVSGRADVVLDLCVRDYDWSNVEKYYSSYLADNVRVVHASGSALGPLYERADVGMLLYRPSEYRDLSMPVKLFEYLGMGAPIVTARDTAAGSFVEESQCGWTIEPSAGSLSELLDSLVHNPSDIDKKRANCLRAQSRNTWKARAEKVARTLSPFEKR